MKAPNCQPVFSLPAHAPRGTGSPLTRQEVSSTLPTSHQAWTSGGGAGFEPQNCLSQTQGSPRLPPQRSSSGTHEHEENAYEYAQGRKTSHARHAIAEGGIGRCPPFELANKENQHNRISPSARATAAAATAKCAVRARFLPAEPRRQQDWVLKVSAGWASTSSRDLWGGGS